MNNRAMTELMTPQQAADMLNVSRQWVRKFLDDGILVAVEVDGKELLRSSAVLAYQAERDARRGESMNEIIRLGTEPAMESRRVLEEKDEK